LYGNKSLGLIRSIQIILISWSNSFLRSSQSRQQHSWRAGLC